jgi:hypothetical protein
LSCKPAGNPQVSGSSSSCSDHGSGALNIAL